MIFTPSDKQAEAIKRIVAWWKDPKAPQVFYLAGFAGTGKSTVYALVLEALGAKQVVTCAYTGKAASVLRKKGAANAMTVHSAIYSPIEDPETGEVTFVKNEESPAALADLIGLDECSMIDDKMAGDLMSFGKRILIMGDPGQLPPIRGQGFFTAGEPDFFLSEVHRQAADSPILRLATWAREGKPIPVGHYGMDVKVLKLDREAHEEIYREGTQVLCGVHRVRHTITQFMRARLGFQGEQPHAGERLICIRNNRKLGIYNGVQGVALKAGVASDVLLKMDVQMDDLERPLRRESVFRYPFEGHFRTTERPQGFKGVLEFDWGLAITAHKAQGSEWPHVTVVDDSGAFREDAARWTYTAITRASEGLTLLKRAV